MYCARKSLLSFFINVKYTTPAKENQEDNFSQMVLFTDEKIKFVNNLQYILAKCKNAVIIWSVNLLQKMENIEERKRRKENGKDSCTYGR